MTIPSVTFPVKQENIKSTAELLKKELMQLATDRYAIEMMLTLLQRMCVHTFQSGACVHCGTQKHD